MYLDYPEPKLQELVHELQNRGYDLYVTSVGGGGLGVLSRSAKIDGGESLDELERIFEAYGVQIGMCVRVPGPGVS